MGLRQYLVIMALGMGIGCTPIPPSTPMATLPIDAPSTDEAETAIAEETSAPIDEDGDGYLRDDGDCDDTDASINPGALEYCGDGIDNNCDRYIDEPSAEDALPYFLDSDGDGFGDPERYLVGCTPHPGFVAQGDDCDDADPDIHPEATEYCGDKIDFNCDGLVGGPRSEDSQLCVGEDGNHPIKACECPEGFSPAKG